MKSLIVSALAILCLWNDSISAQYLSSKVIAVPRFTNHSKQAAHDWLCEALPDMLTTDIAATKRIRIVNRLELKKIVDEQKLTVTDLMQDAEKISLGKMVGAGSIVTGSFSVMADKVRIDAQVFDAETGAAETATSVEGPLAEVFLLEKQLATKLLEAMNLELSEVDLINLLQIPSRNIQAIEAYYQGIIALDNQKNSEAQEHLARAVHEDPFYRQAKTDYESLVTKVDGASLFADAVNQLDAKAVQLEAMKKIFGEFMENYYVVTVAGKPEIVTDSSRNDVATVKVPLNVTINPEAVDTLFKNLAQVSRGPVALEFPDKYGDQIFNFYQENAQWLKSHRYHSFTWEGYHKTFEISLYVGNKKLISREVEIRKDDTYVSFYFPKITAGQQGNYGKYKIHKSGSIYCIFENINVEDIKKVSSVTVTKL